MSDIQLFPQPQSSSPKPAPAPQERRPWSEDELTHTVEGASPHVRFLLKELSASDDVPARQLKSKRVAYAIVQRICNSQNKDSLVLSRENERGEKTYRLNPSYKETLRPLVSDVAEPPPTPARPRKPKSTGMGRSNRNMSATDGIATHGIGGGAPSGFQGAATPRRVVTQTSAGRSLAFPPGTPLDFCQQTLAFLNATSPTRYRIVLDASGPRLEVS